MKTLPKTIYVAIDGDTGDEYLIAQAEPAAFIANPGDARRVAVYELTGYIDVASTVTTKPAPSPRRKS